jgi:hypothetical protein
MDKIVQPSTGVNNVGLGQVATHNLRKGPRYHHVTYVVTVAKIAVTAGFTSPKLQDILDVVETRVASQAKRSCKAIELDTMQQAWGGVEYGYTAIDNIQNDLITPFAGDGATAQGAGFDYKNTSGVTQVVNGVNVPNNSTMRLTTFLFTVYFAEPWRLTYTSRLFFAIPTSWATGKTIAIQNALTLLNPGNLYNPVVRAEELIDMAQGPFAKTLANGQPDLTSGEVFPMVNFWPINKNYGATQFTIGAADWGNVSGKLQQISLFGQVGDTLQKFKLLADNTPKRDTTKTANDGLNQKYEWDAPIPTLTAPYDNTNVTHIALDFSDDVTDWLNFDAYNDVELQLTLTAANAANKSMRAIVQAYDIVTVPNS